MRVSEGWRRIFVVLSLVYWMFALIFFVYGVSAFPGEVDDVASWMVVFAILYGVLAGLVAGVVWIVAGFRKSNSAGE